MAPCVNNLFLFPSLYLQQSFTFWVKLNLILSFLFRTAQHKAVAPGHSQSFAYHQLCSPKSAPHLICMGWALHQANESDP